MLPDVSYTRAYTRVCVARREREREHRARETPEQKEARLYQRRLRDSELFS